MILRKAEINDVAGITIVHIETWRTTYKGIVPDEIIQNLSSREKDEKWSQMLKEMIKTEIYYVAEDENGKIIGFAVGGLERSGDPTYKGELMGIYILKEYQNIGIGRTLIKIIVTELLKLGINNMLVWVLKENPYKTFYEKIGGKVIKERLHEKLKLPVLAYGWDNLEDLLNKLEN